MKKTAYVIRRYLIILALGRTAGAVSSALTGAEPADSSGPAKARFGELVPWLPETLPPVEEVEV